MNISNLKWCLLPLCAFTMVAHAANLSGCSLNGIPLFGKVKVVNSFPDFKVKQVNAFADLKVKPVNAFADSCGKWEFVETFPDFTVQFVDAFEDFSITFVEAFPGTN